MSARVRVGPFTVEQRGGEWYSTQPELEKRARTIASGFDPSGADPEPDRTEALLVTEQLGGRLTRYRRPAIDNVLDLIGLLLEFGQA